MALPDGEVPKVSDGAEHATADPPAAELDSRLGSIDWSVLPQGAVQFGLEAPSGTLAAAAMGERGRIPVLLVPGVMGSKEDFSLLMPLLASEGYYVQAYDLAGQYQSAAAGPEHLSPPRMHYDYDLYVEDLLAALDLLGEPAHVLGYSFAGVVAELALLRRPDMFRTLTLMSAPPEPGLAFRSVSVLGPLAPLVSGPVSADLIVWGVKRNFVRVPPSRMDFVRSRFRYTRRQSIRDIITLMRHVPDVRSQLAGQPLPKLVAVGEHDVWPNRVHAGFARAIKGRLAVYRGGHSPCETAPHQLARDLLALYEDAGP
ncbi:alpha/beta hydrolase [Arthrobacter gandavensis]|uniref:alpha/beta fold hydrolase n=1 Tax=Arthrobacter gandavensis TaxID=169960 RepID=UPI00188E24F7|nr:alpha/beta hydrolase [Arthrobacter gandavensis]MBF4995055.1 alpha/beta hydrolase [Arthrobacter gandavensis]